MSHRSLLIAIVCIVASGARAADLDAASAQVRELAEMGQFRIAYDRAVQTLKEHSGDDPVALARFDLLQARLLMFTTYGEVASDAVSRAEPVAQSNDNAMLKADLLATRARLLEARRDPTGALKAYDEAYAAYEAQSALTEQIETFTASMGVVGDADRERYRARAEQLLKSDLLTVRQSRALRFAAASLGNASADTWATLARESDSEPRAAATAWLRCAEAQDRNGQRAEALASARKGLFAAQKSGDETLLFRLDWQIARLQKSGQSNDRAIDSYFRAVRSLSGIRHDLLVHLSRGGAPGTFRKNIGPVYYQLADMLIRRSEAKPDDQQQSDLKLARQVVEQLKIAELEDYFQDQCVNLAKEQEQIVDRDLQSAAVVYLVPLEDRTEILISTPGGRIERVTSPATDQQISEAAKRFRFDATNRRNANYLKSGKQLYDWVIAPMLPVLKKSADAAKPINTLVFVPDGDLRMVPMAALWSGEQFLVEQYAIAISPGLTLMRPEPLDRSGKTLQVLKAGVTIERQVGNKVFAALPNVSSELDGIQKLYPGALLKDETFRNAQIEQRLEQDAFTIVHIASHGQFRPEARDTFLLTYDSTLNLDQLERLMLPSKFRDQPIELLTLSACQTAAGDEGARAALGMAGIAVKAGARSAMATLWFVSDEAAGELVGQFYDGLRDDPLRSRAQCLQRAQLHVIAIDRFRHPYYWAPFLMIGNWK